RGGWLRRRGARTDEAGSALVELTWLGLLLIIPLVYVLITLVTVQRSAYGATEAARSAGRAFVLSPDLATARERAYEAARVAMGDQDVDLAPGELVIVCHPAPASCLRPGSTVEVRVELQVPLPLVPDFMGRSTASIAVDARHVEPYGVYREAAG
ncbi:MAG: hypothetical protein ACRDP4_08990, partial [Nocardioidaceae bacterium]